MIESIKIKKQLGIGLSCDEAWFILKKSEHMQEYITSQCGKDLEQQDGMMRIYINHMMHVFPRRDVGQSYVSHWMYMVLDELGI
jgi:hypothetical protein